MTESTRNKGGRPSGAAWASKRAAGVRKAAKANQLAILADRDPLAELIRIGFEEEDVNVRVRALSAALPHLYPRLSMSVIAEASPEQSREISREMLESELLDRMRKRGLIEQATMTIEADTDCQTEDKS